MTSEGHKVASLTGAYEGAQRDAIIDAFRVKRAKVLITTNVLARGIDVQSVNLVINYVRDAFFRACNLLTIIARIYPTTACDRQRQILRLTCIELVELADMDV